MRIQYTLNPLVGADRPLELGFRVRVRKHWSTIQCGFLGLVQTLYYSILVR